MHNFKKLKIWQESIKTVSISYSLTRTFTDFEKFGLAGQMNRSALSIPSNIAEGSRKSTDRRFNKFLQDSLGSAFEWETQLIVAFNEGYLDESNFNDYQEKINKVQKMISSFQSSLQA